MQLQKNLEQLVANNFNPEQESEKVLTHQLHDELAKFRHFKSTRTLEKSPLYQVVSNEILKIIYGYEYGCFAESPKLVNKPFNRAVLWNLDRGKNFRGILESIRNRAFVSLADVYFFPAVDIGLARSHNHNIVRDLALELGYNYVFSTTFLHLDDDKNQDKLGIEGNAIMTRYPVSNFRIIPLRNVSDPLQGRRKRLGCEKVLLVDVNIDGNQISLACVNIPRKSSQRQRAKLVKFVMHKLSEEGEETAILVGANLSSNNYKTTSPANFFMSVFNKVFRGYKYIKDEHHSYPEKYFEKKLFDHLEIGDFEYKPFNEEGQGTYNLKTLELAPPNWKTKLTYKLTEKLLTKHSDDMSFKTDWFVANKRVVVSKSHQAERPRVITHLFHEGNSVSNHDPVLLDFEIKS